MAVLEFELSLVPDTSLCVYYAAVYLAAQSLTVFMYKMKIMIPPLYNRFGIKANLYKAHSTVPGTQFTGPRYTVVVEVGTVIAVVAVVAIIIVVTVMAGVDFLYNQIHLAVTTYVTEFKGTCIYLYWLVPKINNKTHTLINVNSGMQSNHF